MSVNVKVCNATGVGAALLCSSAKREVVVPVTNGIADNDDKTPSQIPCEKLLKSTKPNRFVVDGVRAALSLVAVGAELPL